MSQFWVLGTENKFWQRPESNWEFLNSFFLFLIGGFTEEKECGEKRTMGGKENGGTWEGSDCGNMGRKGMWGERKFGKKENVTRKRM